jgi:hypothetical protein
MELIVKNKKQINALTETFIEHTKELLNISKINAKFCKSKEMKDMKDMKEKLFRSL